MCLTGTSKFITDLSLSRFFAIRSALVLFCFVFKKKISFSWLSRDFDDSTKLEIFLTFHGQEEQVNCEMMLVNDVGMTNIFWAAHYVFWAFIKVWARGKSHVNLIFNLK